MVGWAITAPNDKRTQPKRKQENTTKTAALFVLVKVLQVPKKCRENDTHQKKIRTTKLTFTTKQQKPERAPGRENSTTRQANLLPNKLPTNQQFFQFRFLKKK